MSTHVTLLLEQLRHYLRVAGVTFFVVCFVTFTTRARHDWFSVASGITLGLFFGLIFVFGDKWADALEKYEVMG